MANPYSQIAPLVGEQIEKAMAEEGISTAELAEKLGVTATTVYRYQAGENLTLDTIYRIAEICHQSVSFFIPNTLAEGIVAEGDGDGWIKDKARVELVRLVKIIVRTADDGVVRALLENAKQFLRITPKKE